MGQSDSLRRFASAAMLILLAALALLLPGWGAASFVEGRYSSPE